MTENHAEGRLTCNYTQQQGCISQTSHRIKEARQKRSTECASCIKAGRWLHAVRSQDGAYHWRALTGGTRWGWGPGNIGFPDLKANQVTVFRV